MTEVFRMKKPGEWALSRARASEWRLLRANRLLYALVTLFMAALAVTARTAYAFLGDPWLGWFIAGAVLGGAATMLTYEIRSSAGTLHKREGARAEVNTNKALRHINQAEVINGLWFERFDIDHLVISPDGVLAVETKWTSWELELEAHDELLSTFLPCARRSQDKASKYMRFVIRSKVEVNACLVLWGPHVPDTPGGVKMMDGILVLVGRQWKTWVSLFNQQTCLAEADRVAIVDAFRKFEKQQLAKSPRGKEFRSRLTRPLFGRA